MVLGLLGWGSIYGVCNGAGRGLGWLIPMYGVLLITDHVLYGMYPVRTTDDAMYILHTVVQRAQQRVVVLNELITSFYSSTYTFSSSEANDETCSAIA